MEQRVYRGAMTAEGLADYLVAQFDPRPDVQAQKLGRGDSFVVQVGGGDDPGQIRRALTVAIAAAHDGAPGVTVTMGEQEWFSPEQTGHTAFWTLLGAIVTPWALLMLVFPVKNMLEDMAVVSPRILWDHVQMYAASSGAHLAETRDLVHPHGG